MSSGRKRYGLLTERQYQILKLRIQGYKQREVAELLGTARENISVIEKQAMRKIRLAEETLRIYKELLSVDKIRLEPNTYTLDIPKIIFRRADELGIRLKANLSYILGMLHYEADECIRHRKLIKPINILILRDGGLEIICEEY